MKAVHKFLKLYSEYTTLIVAIILFFVSPYILRAIDPTAATYDAGILQQGIVAVILFCAFQAFTWLALNMVWPDLAKYLDTYFKSDFFKLSVCQKITVSLSVYFLVFFFLVLLALAI